MSAEPQTSPPAAHTSQKYAFIDALRGYAVLLVITCHTGGMFAQLPFPLKKLTNFGWHGVQLFFLVSCVTLMMSWRSDERKGIASPLNFWIRRFFRIAPMYYLAAAFYFFAEPPDGGFDLGQLLASLGFVNAWHPVLMPTTPHAWSVVPGGWSIGVEFTFYFLFPAMVFYVRSMRAAGLFVLVALFFGCVANSAAEPGLLRAYGSTATENFLYFWFPNQLGVFALGTVLYFAIDRLRTGSGFPAAMFLSRWGVLVLVGCLVAIVAVINLPLSARLSLTPPAFMPALYAASLIFMVFALVLALKPDIVAINRPICALGEVSFSAYILHFFVLRELGSLLPQIVDPHAEGWGAILRFGVLWLIAVPATFALSWFTFAFIEKPMIEVGRKMQLPRRRIASAAV